MDSSNEPIKKISRKNSFNNERINKKQNIQDLLDKAKNLSSPSSAKNIE